MNELSPDLSYVEGDLRIYPNSFLFKAGNYPDKQIDVSVEDIAAAVASFQPVNLNLEHATHGALQALNGKVGTIRRTWLDATDPTIARGEVAVPLWIDQELAARGVSMEIDRAAKTFCGGALTYTPRISEAALMSRYAEFAGQRHSSGDAADIQSAHDLMVKQGASCKADFAQHTWQGRSALQDIHDIAARSGGVCKANMSANRGHAEFMTQAEVSAMQRLHDAAVSGGAKCNVFDDKDDSSPLAYYSEQSRSTDPPGKGKEKKPMKSFMDELKALFTGHGIPIEDESPGTPATTTTPQTPHANAAGFSVAEFDAAKTERDAYKGIAEAHFNAVVADAEKAAIRYYGQAEGAKKAAELKKVTFSSSTDVASIEERRNFWNEMADAKFGIGKGADGGAARQTEPQNPAEFAQEAGSDPERIAKLLATTPLGKTAAAQMNGKGGH